jgi:hypothetical protein
VGFETEVFESVAAESGVAGHGGSAGFVGGDHAGDDLVGSERGFGRGAQRNEKEGGGSHLSF